MKKIFNNFIKYFLIVSYMTLVPFGVYAKDVINLDGPSLLPKAEIFVAPRTGNFTVGSTFDLPIYIDTKGNRINTISLKVDYDPKKLAIVNPSGGKSIFGIWIQAPKYDNNKGTASLAGSIFGGINTSSGLIVTMTFKAISSGATNVNITDYSSANLDDGLGTEVKLLRSGGYYTLSPKAPEGVAISSETHPIEDNFYSNNSPILRWGSMPNINGYSVTLDSNPNTTPPTVINTTENSKNYENLQDGIWYFHVRSNVSGVWGNTSHFQIKIDTKAPARFNLEVNNLKDTYGNKKYLVSFITTDSLSGIHHYEVGVIDNTNGEVSSPVFIQTDSPYLAPNTTAQKMRIIVRAYDNAGNIVESSVDLYPGFTFMNLFKRYFIYLLIFILLIILLELLLHYLFGHHILDHLRKAYSIFKKVEVQEASADSSIKNSSEIPNNPLK